MEQNNNNKGNSGYNKQDGIRIGVYVCHCGGNISDVVDVEKVVEAVSGLPDVKVAVRNMFMCSDPGQSMVVEDIRDKKINRVVIAACSPSLHEVTFRQTLVRSGLNPYLYEHANIREQVSWVSKSDPDGATEKAIRLVAAAVAKARLLSPLEPIRVKAKQHVAVIGGGISGLRCARDLSVRGFRVSLLERSPFIGGRMAQLHNVYPTGDNARKLLHELVDEVNRDSKITVYTQAEVSEISDYIGNFNLKVRLRPRGVNTGFDNSKLQSVMDACPEKTDNEFDYGLSARKAIYLPYAGCYPNIPAIDWELCTGCGECARIPGVNGINLEERENEITINAGVIILATGFDHYEPSKGEYGYGEHAEVITLP
ncbi:MAG: FAD-dependent oxidoreductase, partial [bacterium]